MNKKLKTATRITIFVAAFIGMGMSLPSCPGDKAMQQQIDMLQQSNADMTKKLQALDTQIKTAANDLNSTKSVMAQVATAISAQKEAFDRMDAAIKALQARPAPKAPAAKGKARKH